MPTTPQVTLPQVTLPEVATTTPSTMPAEATAASSPSASSKSLPNLAQTQEYVSEQIADMEDFFKKMQRKQARWVDELNAMMTQGEISVQMQIRDLVNMLGGGKLLEIERRRVSINLLYLMKKVMSAIGEKATVNYAMFKDYFFRNKRHELRAVIDYLKQYAYFKDPSFVSYYAEDAGAKAQAQAMQQNYMRIQSMYNVLITGFHKLNETYYETLSNLVDSDIADMYTVNMRDKERANVLKKKNDLLEEMSTMSNKIKYFYTLNYSITEMFDMQFVIMYIIKAVRIASFYISMNMATNVFLQKYDSTVYDKKVTPPSLISYMWIFFGFDLFFNTFILVLLGLVGFLFKTENNTFPIDSYLFYKFAFDYVVTTLVIMVIGMLIGVVIKKKKYFRYKTEGERGIRAFEEIMKSTATVITLIPTFMVMP
jgi:uncharacterized integral membrane protein